MNIDHTIVLYLNQLAASSPVFSGATVFFAHYLPWLVSAVFVLWALRGSQVRRARLALLAHGFGTASLSWLVAVAARLFIHRPRPFVADPTILALVEKTTYSFPSGHAAFFFALATVVYARDRRAGPWFFLAAGLIGLARVAAGVHYLSDILGGAALGVAVGWGVQRFFVKKTPRLGPPL